MEKALSLIRICSSSSLSLADSVPSLQATWSYGSQPMCSREKPGVSVAFQLASSEVSPPRS